MLKGKELLDYIVSAVRNAHKAGEVAELLEGGVCSHCGREGLSPDSNFCDCCARAFVTVAEVKKKLRI